MKLTFDSRRVRWIMLVGISATGLFFAYVGRNGLPLLAVLFAIIFLSAGLIKETLPASKGFVGRLALAALAAILVVSALNYVINPFGLYPPHLFEPLVLTTRDTKMNLYKAYSPPPQAVIMGSSRSFPVDPDQIERLWGYTTFNFSVAAGTMRDFLPLLRYTSEVGRLPDLLIINVAPELFLWNDDQRYVTEPNAQLWNRVEHQDSLIPLKDGLYRMVRLLTKEQLEASLRVLLVKVTGQTPSAQFVTEPNGMIPTTGTVLSTDDLKAERVLNSIGTYFGPNFYQDTTVVYRLDVLQQILEIAKQQHILVIGYIPPYHPAMRVVLETRTAFTTRLDDLVRQLDHLEKEYSFHYLNFVDSPKFLNDDSMFHDLIHPTNEASAAMMQQLYDQFHGYAQPHNG